VPDIIDIDYGYNDVFHHTVQDTIDKLSPAASKSPETLMGNGAAGERAVGAFLSSAGKISMKGSFSFSFSLSFPFPFRDFRF